MNRPTKIIALAILIALGVIFLNNSRTEDCMRNKHESEIMRGYASDGTPMITSKKDSDMADGVPGMRLCSPK